MNRLNRVAKRTKVKILLNLLFVSCLKSDSTTFFAFCNQTYHYCYYSDGEAYKPKMRGEADKVCKNAHEEGRVVDMEDPYTKMEILQEFMTNYSLFNTALNAINHGGTWRWKLNNTAAKMHPKYLPEGFVLFLKLKPEISTNYVVCMLGCKPTWVTAPRKSFGNKNITTIDNVTSLEACRMHCLFTEGCLAVEWREKCTTFEGKDMIYITMANATLYKISRYKMDIPYCFGNFELKYQPVTIPTTTTPEPDISTTTTEEPVKEKETVKSTNAGNPPDLSTKQESIAKVDKLIQTRADEIRGPTLSPMDGPWQTYLVAGLIVLGVIFVAFKMLKKNESSSSDEEE